MSFFCVFVVFLIFFPALFNGDLVLYQNNRKLYSVVCNNFFFDVSKQTVIFSAEFSRQVFRKHKHQDREEKRFSKQHAVIALSTREEKKRNN